MRKYMNKVKWGNGFDGFFFKPYGADPVIVYLLPTLTDKLLQQRDWTQKLIHNGNLYISLLLNTSNYHHTVMLFVNPKLPNSPFPPPFPPGQSCYLDYVKGISYQGRMGMG